MNCGGHRYTTFTIIVLKGRKGSRTILIPYSNRKNRKGKKNKKNKRTQAQANFAKTHPLLSFIPAKRKHSLTLYVRHTLSVGPLSRMLIK
jgi:hypothetical protein